MNPKKDEEVRSKTHWRLTKPSSAWRRLVKKLFKKRGEPAGTRQDADEGRKED